MYVNFLMNIKNSKNNKMSNKKSITFVIKTIKEQEFIFVQMHKDSLHWTMPTVLINTNYNILKGTNFIIRKFNWINIKRATTIFDLETEYNGQTIKTIFCEILIDKDNLKVDELNNNPTISFQRFIPISGLNVLRTKTIYITHYLNFISKKISHLRKGHEKESQFR